MFKKVLGTITTAQEGAKAEESKPQMESLQRLVAQNSNFQFGTNVLLNSGVISPKILAKLNKYRPNPEAMRLLSAIDMSNESLAREIGLDSNFLDMNEDFLKSGQAVKAAVEKGMLDLARALIDRGYNVPDSLLIDAIRDDKRELIRNTIQGQFYGREGCIELDFWYLVHEHFHEEATLLQEIEPLIRQITVGYDFSNPASFDQILNDRLVQTSALSAALRRGQDTLATMLLEIDPRLVQNEFVSLAIKTSCMEFLRRVWSGDHELAEGSELKKRKRKSVIWDTLDQGQGEKSLKLSNIIEQFLTRKKVAEVKQILTWPEAASEPGLVKVLIDYEQQDLAKSLLSKGDLPIDSEDVINSFEKRQYELCVRMVQSKEARVALETPAMQAELVKLLANGNTCLPAIEMLNLVSNKAWNLDLTKPLCSILVGFAKKTTELVVCHAPLLFIALAAEFLTRLSDVSLQHETRCLATAKFIIDFGMAIEDSIKEEEELKYFMTQKDSRNRTVLTICSDNRFYSLLEHDEIGTIVSKMWNGAKKNYGLMGALTLYQSLEAPSSSEEAMSFAKPLDFSKPYIFQYEQWTESCSLRFLAQAIAGIIHVIVYQMLIYTAISEQSFYNVAASSKAVVYLRIAQVWVAGIACDHFLHILFAWKTHRQYHINIFRLVDYLMFIVTILIMIEIQNKLMGPGKPITFIDPSVFNAILHSIMVVVIWIRFMSLIIASKRFGPFLRMLFLMIESTLNFFVLFTCMGICCSAIFTSLFNASSNQFTNFSTSIRSLFASSVGNFDLTDFSDNIGLGAVLLGIFCVLANALMLNLIIALLANIYDDLKDKVDSEHRAVVVSYYNRWSWDENYGVLIFMPTPLCFLSLMFSPFFLGPEPAKWNRFYSRVFYVIYAVVQFLFFLLGGLFWLIPCYFKGFLFYPKSQASAHQIQQGDQPAAGGILVDEEAKEEEEEAEDLEQSKYRTFDVRLLFMWSVIGLPWLFWSLFRDCRDFWKLLYVSSVQSTEIEGSKINALVTEKFIMDVQMVLKSITTPVVSLEQFVETWFMVDQSNFNSGENGQDSSSTERKDLAMDYFSQFISSSNDETIDIVRMKMLLPRRVGHVYDEEYLQRARHVNVPWFLKGVRKYQQQIGSINIGGLSIPKKAEQKSQTSSIDKEQLDTVQKTIKEMEQRFSDLLLSARNVKMEMENRTKALKALGTVAKAEDEVPRETLW